jgi:hypothetical protein
VEGVCQLKGLKDLSLFVSRTEEGLLLQLTQLKHLTSLGYEGPLGDGDYGMMAFIAQVGCAECLMTSFRR